MRFRSERDQVCVNFFIGEGGGLGFEDLRIVVSI